MDKVIQPTIVLLILSLITEKIADFFKLQSQFLANKQISVIDEKLREKKIQHLTIIVGVVIALISKANLFDFFKDNFKLFWTEDDFIGVVLLSNIIGSIVSGLFLSLGSKFFHDLLDVLLQVKNLKRKMNEKADWEFDNITEVDEYVQNNDVKNLKSFLDNYFNSIQGYFFYELDYENLSILVHVKNGTTGIQKIIPYKSLVGKTKLFQVKIQEQTTEIKTLAISLSPSDEIANEYPFQNVLCGSISFPFLRKSDNKKFILTCYHAVWNENHDWDIFIPIGKENVVYPMNGQKIGKIKFAFKNARLDVALIELNSDSNLSDDIPLLNNPKSARKVDTKDKKGKTSVKIKSTTSNTNPSIGYIYDIDVSANILYPDGIYRSLSNLIMIKPYKDLPFSVGGDSGSLIIDEWDYAIGIVVAGNEKDTTFAIPIMTILESLNLKIK